jgi:hypothetical protein
MLASFGQSQVPRSKCRIKEINNASVLLAVIAMTGFSALTALNASAAPSASLVGVTAMPASGMVTKVDYYWNHHHYHHRRMDHGHWRYWN